MRRRLITAALLLAVIIPLILYAKPWLLSLVLTLILALAVGEWWKLVQGRRPVVIILVACLLLLLPQWLHFPGYFFVLVAWLSLAFWLALGLGLWLRERRRLFSWLPWLLWPTLLPAFWLASRLQILQPAFLLWLILLIAASDSAALFFGKAFGRMRLAPSLSPGKTWAGFWGGLLAGLFGGTLGAAWFWTWRPENLLLGAGVGLLAALAGVLGDLWESFLKRSVGRKDSGQLLPGHGGILDRIDALTAATPVFFLLLSYWGKL